MQVIEADCNLLVVGSDNASNIFPNDNECYVKE